MMFAPQDFNFQAAPFAYNGPSMASVASGLPGLAPTAPAGTGGPGFLGTAGMVLGGLQTIGNLWGAFQAAKLAKKQFNFTKDITETNLANQIKSYNTALADRARSRGVMEGQSPDQVSQYVSANSLARDGAKTASGSVGNITAAALSNYRLPDQRTGS